MRESLILYHIYRSHEDIEYSVIKVISEYIIIRMIKNKDSSYPELLPGYKLDDKAKKFLFSKLGTQLEYSIQSVEESVKDFLTALEESKTHKSKHLFMSIYNAYVKFFIQLIYISHVNSITDEDKKKTINNVYSNVNALIQIKNKDEIRFMHKGVGYLKSYLEIDSYMNDHFFILEFVINTESDFYQDDTFVDNVVNSMFNLERSCSHFMSFGDLMPVMKEKKMHYKLYKKVITSLLNTKEDKKTNVSYYSLVIFEYIITLETKDEFEKLHKYIQINAKKLENGSKAKKIFYFVELVLNFAIGNHKNKKLVRKLVSEFKEVDGLTIHYRLFLNLVKVIEEQPTSFLSNLFLLTDTGAEFNNINKYVKTKLYEYLVEQMKEARNPENFEHDVSIVLEYIKQIETTNIDEYRYLKTKIEKDATNSTEPLVRLEFFFIELLLHFYTKEDIKEDFYKSFTNALKTFSQGNNIFNEIIDPTLKELVPEKYETVVSEIKKRMEISEKGQTRGRKRRLYT